MKNIRTTLKTLKNFNSRQAVAPRSLQAPRRQERGARGVGGATPLLSTEKSHFSVLNQKGAIFGLDARIALAIFGVLSIVAGVSSLSVLSTASTTALVTELNNMKKAYQEFHLSTGEHTTRFMDLIDNNSNIIGWSGPYIDLLSNNNRTYGVYSFSEGRQDVNGVPPVECSGGGICAIWLKLTAVKDSVAAKLDEQLDATKSPNAGTFRIEYQQGATDDIYYLVTARH